MASGELRDDTQRDGLSKREVSAEAASSLSLEAGFLMADSPGKDM